MINGSIFYPGYLGRLSPNDDDSHLLLELRS